MEKFRKAMQCLLLAAALLLNLCACQSAGDYRDETKNQNATEETIEETTEAENPLVGVWEWKWNLTQAVNAELSEEVAKYVKITDHYYIVILELREDGSCRLAIDEEAYKPVREHMVAELREGMTNYIAAMLEEGGYDMTVAEYMQYRGTTMTEFVESTVKNLDPQTMNLGFVGYYKAEGDKLYMEETPYFGEEDASEFIQEGDNLTIKNGIEGLFESMDFVRVTD